ncbi:hypothetical protein GGR50DRAFT_703244 [Xylaria sp. CBS 124048]|nr:hypothetical protein GGR50DRAFT_703244 [Xylaria sp. CBS 124048]
MDDSACNIDDSQPDQYARDNQLSLDSWIDPFSLVLRLNSSFPQPTPDAESDSLTSDTFLPQLRLPTLCLREHLNVPKESIELLAKALLYEATNLNDQPETPLAQYDRRKRLAKLKFESPLLASDPDYDCRKLSRAIQEYRRPKYGPGMFPSERLNMAMDEGLEFPDSAHRFSQMLNHVARHEKLDMPKEAIYGLARALQDDWSGDEVREVLGGSSPRRSFLRDLVVTPPLSPLSQHEERFIPDAEVCKVPIMSDPSSMLSDDAKAAESVIVQRELEKDASMVFDIGTPKLSPLLGQRALSKEPIKLRSLKMESPLSPATALPSIEEPTIPALLKSMDIDRTLSSPDPLKTNIGQTDSMDDPFDQNFSTAVEEIAANVMRRIEQEQINVAHATARVEVPTVDFSIPAPEWQDLPMDVRAHLKWLLEKYGARMPSFPRISRRDSQLRWVPFMQRIDLRALTDEMFDCEEDLSQLLSFPNAEEVPTSADYVWKRPGLAILREPEGEEDVEEITSVIPAMPTPKSLNDLAGLAKKRRLDSDRAETRQISSPGPNLSKRPLQKSQIDQGRNLLLGTESHSAISTLLSNYIDIRTAKRRKQSHSSFFGLAGKSVEPQLGPVPVASRSREGIPPSPQIAEQPDNHVTLQAPCPEVVTPNVPTKLIKGLNLSRGLFSRIEQLYPKADIIERDFDRWGETAQDYHSMGPAIVPPVAAEADIIVSAATGIIVTTLLKVIQKPLPGRGGQSSIRERIHCVAFRYERLIVLVSEGNAIDETVRGLTPSETTGYADFICFAARLDAKVEVFYVGGGEATLAKWLVHLAIQHAPEATLVQEHLSQDETQWEVFLRRMGFNAYAAQAVLVRLRERGRCLQQNGKSPVCGLAGFMVMSSAEREERFRDLIGERVLKRINRALEAKWS